MIATTLAKRPGRFAIPSVLLHPHAARAGWVSSQPTKAPRSPGTGGPSGTASWSTTSRATSARRPRRCRQRNRPRGSRHNVLLEEPSGVLPEKADRLPGFCRAMASAWFNRGIRDAKTPGFPDPCQPRMRTGRAHVMPMTTPEDTNDVTLPINRAVVLRDVSMPSGVNATRGHLRRLDHGPGRHRGQHPVLSTRPRAGRHGRRNPFVFGQIVLVADPVSAGAEAARVGRTSATVDVGVFAQRGLPPRAVVFTEATLTHVAMNASHRPRPVHHRPDQGTRDRAAKTAARDLDVLSIFSLK